MIRESLKPPEFFVGRQKQLEWMHRIVSTHDRWLSPFFILGPAGIGKHAFITALLEMRRKRPWSALGLTLEPGKNLRESIEEVWSVVRQDRENHFEGLAIAVDGADALTPLEIEKLHRGLLNFKRVRAVFVLSRKDVSIEKAPVLRLGPLASDEAAELFFRLSKADLPSEIVSQIILRCQGNPALIQLHAGIVRVSGTEGLNQILSGVLYRATDVAPKGTIISAVKPLLISTTHQLIAELRKTPESIFNLTSRKFEELLAEILADLGMEVELTQATRDGGRDILAHFTTPIGKMLCLVEAKKYRQDRTVSVGLVRQLYGTLRHYEANSAMMVTTSKYSNDARAFKESHKYVLDLKEYSHVVQWINEYKRSTKSGLILPQSY